MKKAIQQVVVISFAILIANYVTYRVAVVKSQEKYQEYQKATGVIGIIESLFK